MEPDLIRRAEDLSRRCEKQAAITSTGFLTPAEQAELTAWAARSPEVTLQLFGGQPGCERQAAFFLPSYFPPETLEPQQELRALCITSAFGTPGHRDYLGALLGLGVKREWLGDIRIHGQQAYVFCLPSVERYVLDNLTHVGRCGVRTAAVALEAVPLPEWKVKPVQFTVQSMRLDAIVGGIFGLSRGAAAEHIRAGSVSLNYLPCLKPDAPVKPGDVLSLRGRGKGSVLELGGSTRKGRQFVRAELWQ